MKSIKNLIFLLLFLLSTALMPAAFASDRPVWGIDYKKLNLPEYGIPLSSRPDPRYKVQFTPDNKILVSFLENRYLPLF